MGGPIKMRPDLKPAGAIPNWKLNQDPNSNPTKPLPQAT